MSVDATVPLGTDLVTCLDDYMRENREQINLLWSAVIGGAGQAAFERVNITQFQTYLTDGTDMTRAGLGILGLTADVAVDLTAIKNAPEGSLKMLVALDDDVTLIQSTTGLGGTFWMNAPTGVDLELHTRDIIMFVNINGEVDCVDGYWIEVFRKLAVS